MRLSFSSFVFLLLCIQCTSIAKRQEYEDSLRAYKKANLENAIDYLPTKEKKGFIGILERAHLGFLKGETNYKKLEQLANDSKERLRFSASRSLKSFFYMETEEGYYASEAEIIYLHILLGLYYVRAGEYEKGKIQARYAGNLLSGEWSAEGQFDDPTLRLLLASLWLSTGSIEEAKVDFRRASQQKPQSAALRSLANERFSGNEEFILIFGGPGAEPEMDPSVNLNFIRGLRNLKFRLSGKQSQLSLVDGGTKTPLVLEKDTLIWYERHLTRDNAISELIEDSKYFQLVSASALKEGTKGTVKVTGAILASATIVAFGAGVVYLGAEANSGQAIGMGFVIIGYGFKLGADWIETSYDDARRNMRKDLDISDEYRYVRFFPEYVWMGKSRSNLVSPKLQMNPDNLPYTLSPAMGKVKVRFGFFPDNQRP
ncbi:hypothetical protein ND861_11685 [Leptospira sp. 2 VSF19]|uniref:Tetratricopeptide repeat protein n=1 Tax=Leptospira soteropolitanensis TaxID=2950025 RepID=A0AAW5VKU8_9LEPT|nr:hypothetical protein [Leptospira soteropolitanensis]MCW7493033.1 hypothetical protein [Leptospira soteropolitanensis]MCW7500897.1 hypothetical protein [Leptospira soteropolitanensis]MCW7522884.1 hypothetical protein [Leptospira soteropolitanensis]MCW7527010.1 hypothetical protein [Leptospira soteropolitanensis]MCW7530602.1 hypothetical protein [Leptospira soteropolitanensis]